MHKICTTSRNTLMQDWLPRWKGLNSRRPLVLSSTAATPEITRWKCSVVRVPKRIEGEKDLETIHCITRMVSIYTWQRALKKVEELKIEPPSLCNEFLIDKHPAPFIVNRVIRIKLKNYSHFPDPEGEVLGHNHPPTPHTKRHIYLEFAREACKFLTHIL